MSNPTTPFGWQMPTATDLVTDLPADFEVFGQAVATSMGDLLGGTTGQVLAKASNTDMDFVWSADAAGMTNPMTTTGDVIYSSPGSTPVRLGIGSTGQGLSVVAGIPAWAASAQSTLTTTGDTLYASAANTLARRAIGSTGDVLTVAGGIPTWAAPATGGGMTLLASGTLSGTAVTLTSISQSYENLIIFVRDYRNNASANDALIRLNTNSTCLGIEQRNNNATYQVQTNTQHTFAQNVSSTASDAHAVIFLPDYTTADVALAQSISYTKSSNTTPSFLFVNSCFPATTAAISTVAIESPSTWGGGTYELWGQK